MQYIIQHHLDCDDHGNFFGWEILSDDQVNKYISVLNEYKEKYGDNFSFYTCEWDSEIKWDYKKILDLINTRIELSDTDVEIIKKYTNNCEWLRLDYIFFEAEESLSSMKDDEIVGYVDDDDNEYNEDDDDDEYSEDDENEYSEDGDNENKIENNKEKRPEIPKINGLPKDFVINMNTEINNITNSISQLFVSANDLNPYDENAE